MAGKSSAQTSNDPRFEGVFSVERESTAGGHALIADPHPLFAQLRDQGAIYPGDPEEALTGIANPQFSRKRPHYTTLTIDASSKALQDNMTYSSLHHQEMQGLMMSVGHTVLTMGWWRETWIGPSVDILLDAIVGTGSADLALQLCARLPMHTVAAAYGLSAAGCTHAA